MSKKKREFDPKRDAERCYQTGMKAIREYEEENRGKLPHLPLAEDTDNRPNYARDRLKGAAGD